MLCYSISHPDVRSIPINECHEGLADLCQRKMIASAPLPLFMPSIKTRTRALERSDGGLYEALLRMLDHLPSDVGIAYFAALRPLSMQKEYFDAEFLRFYALGQNTKDAYEKACCNVSLYCHNVPAHFTGGAIDITLFRIQPDGQRVLFDMGKFDVIFGPNDQQETFSPNTTPRQRCNRLVLLEAAMKAGLAKDAFEWWHFSDDDRVWAKVKGRSFAMYAGTESNKELCEMSWDAFLSPFKETKGASIY